MKKFFLIFVIVITFTLNAFCADIFNVSPSGGTTLTNNHTYTIKWIDTDSTDYVNIWLWNGNTSSFMMIDSNITASSGQYNWYINTGDYNSKYRIKIQSVNDPTVYCFNTGYFSIIQYQNMISKVLDNNPKKDYHIRIYPNPSSVNELTISSNIPFGNYVDVIIFNSQGQKITSFTQSDTESSYSFVTDVPGLQSGMYLFEIFTNGVKTISKVIIKK